MNYQILPTIASHTFSQDYNIWTTIQAPKVTIGNEYIQWSCIHAEHSYSPHFSFFFPFLRFLNFLNFLFPFWELFHSFLFSFFPFFLKHKWMNVMQEHYSFSELSQERIQHQMIQKSTTKYIITQKFPDIQYWSVAPLDLA